MKKLRVVIRGAVVHDIGYRLFLYESADAVDIAEFQARNITGGVEVLIGGDDTSIDEFVEYVKESRPERAEIEEIQIEEYEGRIKPIERFAQGFMLTQMGKFVSIGLEMLDIVRAIKKDTSTMLEKQDLMLEKQDDTIGEIKGLREDLKSYMERRFNRIEDEIAAIKLKIGMT